MTKWTIVLLLSILTLTTACVGNNLNLPPTTEPFSSPTSLVVDTTIPPNGSQSDKTTPTHIPISSTATLTTVPSNTVMPTVEFTPTPKSNSTIPNNPPSDTIFVWSDTKYGYLEPWIFQENPGFVFADSPIADPSFQAETLAFSQNSHQVAYVFYENHVVLWIADINLKNTVQLWVDESDWLTYFSEGAVGKIIWGPGDQFIILSRKSIGMVYQLQNDIVTHLSGPCDRIAISPSTSLLAVWCPISEGQGSAFLVLEQDGSSLLETSMPEENVFVKEWVFAPGSNQVLYADDSGKLFIWNGNTNIKLDLDTGNTSLAVNEGKALKWSYDGTKILVFGYLNGAYCPESSSVGKLPCWSIRDANTGEVLWWPNEENLPSDVIVGLTDGFEVALSPDNEWVVMSYQDKSFIEHTIVVSIQTGEFQVVSLILFATAFWSK